MKKNKKTQSFYSKNENVKKILSFFVFIFNCNHKM